MSDEHQQQIWNAGPVRIPARTRRRHGSVLEIAPCREPGCTNNARRKQGSRYCEEHARTNGYNPLSGTEPATCHCGTEYRRPHRGIPQSDAARAWHDICPGCRHESPLSLGQLRSHHVPFQLAHGWLIQGKHLRCDLCQRRVGKKSGNGRACIDHSHSCCPRESSCGSCIRGLLCTQCNTTVGSYESLVSRIDADVLSNYLSKIL